MFPAPDIAAVLDEGAAPAARDGRGAARHGGAAAPAVAELRATHDREAPELSGPGPRLARVGDLVIPGPHGWLAMRAYAPIAGRDLPVVAYLHGGGWTVGSIASFDGVARALAAASGALVVSVGYRLAPEHPFPVPVDEATAALRWLADNAGQIGGDGYRLAVAGDSAGANLAAVAARRLRDEGGPRLRMQALVYPVCDAALDTPSARRFATGYGFTAAAMRRYWDLYLDGADGAHPDASPVRADDLSALPPAFVATAEADVLRDEGEAYGAALSAAGVAATVRRYPGTVHGFWRWLARSQASRRAVRDVGAALRGAL
jgi:acetyl esterase/lipase